MHQLLVWCLWKSKQRWMPSKNSCFSKTSPVQLWPCLKDSFKVLASSLPFALVVAGMLIVQHFIGHFACISFGLFWERNSIKMAMGKKPERGKKQKSGSFVAPSATVPPSSSGYSHAPKALVGHTQVCLCLSPSCFYYLFEFHLPCRGKQQNAETRKTLFLPFFPLWV